MNATAEEEHQGKVVARYRNLKKWTQGDLAEALKVDVRTVQRMEGQAVIKNVNRRRLVVGLLAIPAALMGLENERRQANTVGVTVNQDRMSFLEDELATRWEMYHTGGTVRAARGLGTWTQEIGRFATAARGSVWRERAYTLLALSYRLQSCISRDLMRYPEAHKAYGQALQLAQGLGTTELIGSAMAREGVTLLQEGRPQDAIVMLRGALDAIKRAGVPTLRGYILQALSEAYAKTQDAQQCWQCVGLAERIFDRPDRQLEISQVRFTASSILAQKGVDAVVLRDHQRAISLIDRSLTTYDPTQVRGRARLIAQKAEAYYHLGLLDASVATAEDALTLANAVGSSKTVSRLEQFHAIMRDSRWRREPSVARLGALLSA